MAADLGIKRCWFHSSKHRPHYDIPKRRLNEILLKANVVSDRKISGLIKSRLTQDVVDETLNSAVANDYDLNGWSALDLASDITDYSQEYEGIDPQFIAPFIENWQGRQ